MARARTIRPELLKHERVAELPALHRLFFIGLFTIADREGRLEDRPKRIKVETLPYDDCDVDQMLDDLEAHPDRLVVRYEVDGRKLIQIPNFTLYQQVHPKEPASELPECTEEMMQAACMTHASTMHEHPREVREGEEGKEVREGEEGKERESIVDASKSKPRRPRATTEAFDAFWREYPRGDEKKQAREYWHKSIFADEVPAVMAGLANAKGSADWRKDGGQFVPYAIRFLRNRRWEDEHRAPPDGRDPRPILDNARHAASVSMSNLAAVAEETRERRAGS